MKFAYADPPYLGCCGLYGHFHGDDGLCWDDIDTHAQLIARLCNEYPDGWALSGSSPSLEGLIDEMPRPYRVGVWVKPFAIFKPNVNPGYCWEPVLFVGGRKRGRDEPTTRDFVSAPVTLERGTVGAKPEKFCHWVFDLLGADPLTDELVDLFPGSGAVGQAWDTYKRQGVLL